MTVQYYWGLKQFHENGNLNGLEEITEQQPHDWDICYVLASNYEKSQDRIRELEAERDDYILKQKVWEQANDELRSENIRLRRVAQASGGTES